MRAEQYLAPETLAQLAPFTLRARMIVEGVTSGMHRSPYQGLAVEFAEHRPYTPGESLRHLDWKVFGRSDKLYVKRYQQETNLDVMLMLDCSASMRFGTLGMKSGWGGTDAGNTNNRWTKYDCATATAVALAYLCLAQRDRVGMSLFSDGVKASLRRSGVRDQWRKIVQALATERVGGPTAIVRTADEALAKVTNRCLFFVLSDFLYAPAELRDALARFRHRGHDVVLVEILDRQEIRFELDDPTVFEGLEDESRVVADARLVRRAYLEELARHRGEIERIVRGFGYDRVSLDSHDSVGPALSALLARRESFERRSRGG
ncbi:MAG: DUF58 domain-containing protein [Phycisphaeraceae bacterium]|nr:DUF58 domain-containing protein [Phycisphaeraceae bacterium]